MFTIRFIIRFFTRSFVLKSLFVLLLFSLIPIGELVLLFYLNTFWEKYFILALVASTGLIGVFFIFSKAVSVLADIHFQVKEGYYPQKDFDSFAGLFISGIFLIFPGFITDVFGLLFLLPALRVPIGKIITNRIPDKLKELYEYLKLYDSY